MSSTGVISPSDQRLAQSLPVGVIIIDHQFRIVWFNAKAQILFKQASSQSPYLNDQLRDGIDLSEFQVGDDEIVKFYHDGIKHYINCQLFDYGDDYYLLSVQDVSKEIRIQHMRQDFIANVSHELRTPLTVFRGYLEIMLTQKDIPDEKLNEIFEQMSSQTNRMERLVEDLLLLSRLESDMPDVETNQVVYIAPILRDISLDARSLSGKLNHQLIEELDESLEIWGQADELRSAFSNLIYNAVQYTPAGGTITIQSYQDQAYQYVSVQDTGIGIKPQHISKLTQRFYRVDKSRLHHDMGSTGLGLAIVKHVLLRHQAELEVSSVFGEGTTMLCRFKRANHFEP